jgi:tetratricopeptide (TPR) repeat protein
VDHDGLIISSDNPFGIPAVTILGKTIATDAENQNAWDAVDYDHNGLKDIRIVSGDLFPDQEELYPFRQAILTLSWNGEMYVPFQIMYKAVYRTDVVRDADAAFLMGSYEQALLLYTEVIQNEKLRDRASIRHDGLNYFIPQKKMKAYAYYRMMLTHVVQGNLDEALKAYNTLQNQFANDSDASPIAMMAAQFWNQYQSTHEVASSCSKVIGFVNTHPDVLASFALSPYWPTPGEDYEPKDLCPIK